MITFEFRTENTPIGLGAIYIANLVHPFVVFPRSSQKSTKADWESLSRQTDAKLKQLQGPLSEDGSPEK